MVISEPMCEKDSAALEVDCLTQESSRDPKLLWIRAQRGEDFHCHSAMLGQRTRVGTLG